MKTLLASVMLLSSSAVFAWGATGHRAVGEIATKFLEPSVLRKVNKILKGESLAQASTWADEIKSEPDTYKHTYNWHYTTWQTEDHNHSEHTENATTGTLLKSISEQVAVLKDSKSTNDQKVFALRFIAHLIGDLHMPLHVGAGNDQGGNFCKVMFHNRATNLHALWDEGMIDFSNLSFTELARFVLENKTASDTKSVMKGTPRDWALESKMIVPTLYPIEVTPTTDQPTARSYCKREATPEEMPKLAYDYSYKFFPIVQRRIFEGGVRLAYLLNQNLK